jgi:hypothetical protein
MHIVAGIKIDRIVNATIDAIEPYRLMQFNTIHCFGNVQGNEWPKEKATQ